MNRMMTSGNQTVDAMASVNISGNVTPNIWYHTIQRENGRPYLLAAAILAEIVYWYRPMEIRDEHSGFTIGWKKRFKGDYLQKNYSDFAELFGESKRTVKRAVDTLVELQVIRRIFRDVQFGDVTLYNTMYLDLNVRRLLEITYPDRYPSSIKKATDMEMKEDGTEREDACRDNTETIIADDNAVSEVVSIQEDKTENTVCLEQESASENAGDTLLQNMVPPPTKFCTTPLTNMVPPPTKFCTTLLPNLSPPPTKFGNYTENTTENTTEITTETTTQTTFSEIDGMGSIHPSIPETDETIKQMQADIASIREHIGYDWQMTHGDLRTRRRFEEMYNLMCDVICINEPYVNLGGSKVPYFRVREKLLQITGDHLAYVMDCIDRNTGSIGNIQAYTLKSIYNAPSSIETYYAHEVNHDMNFMG